MPHIAQLSPHVADLIAAGEVVERPASVVKELTENAIDAGARSVTVEIQNGGMTLIRVTDDGCGIAPEEVQTAFLRHATSKIKTEYDLEAIGTLGFRGEALAAIASVSRLEALTRRPGDELGTSLALEGGVVLGQEEAGCPVGTTLLVRDLFYNTPARLKFMKKDAAEGAACLAALQRQALAHPEVAFKFLRDGRQELLTPGDGKLHSALYAVLGRDLALGFVPVEGSGEDVSVSGFVSLPACCRGTRGYQFFFVNGRYVKSKSMTAAVEQAYANQRMVGKFPGCVLQLTVKLNQVDVNVHPTKQEVKFGSERQVFSAIYYAVLSALGADKTRPAAESAVRPAVVDQGRQTTLPLHDFTAPKEAPRPITPPVPSPGGRRQDPIVPAAPPVGRPAPCPPAEPVSRPAGTESGMGEDRAVLEPAPIKEPVVSPKPADPVESDGPVAPPPSTPFIPAPTEAELPSPSPISQTLPDTPPSLPLAGEEPQPWRVAGELFHTYIIVEQGEKAFLIDKHAAHERMNFDRMRAQDYAPMSQLLLAPVVFTPTPQEGALLLEHLEELDRVGFEVEDFGGGSLAVRSVPDYLELGDVEAALTEIAGKLALAGSTGIRERRDEILHTMACKAAIKGGWQSAPEELDRVAQAVLSGQVKYCPHGRPVAVELTRGELEKQFKRRT
ncbi:MAG: DNA mismatch repair endonuclease MutL [Oscillospiraceae bacterium]|jgi:DNA mismatch repair protein MutL|nr:DNA mismatch repair endonuclease MutL [Oscillospiraceae bacterium]